jgi:SRSO17 transposase
MSYAMDAAATARVGGYFALIGGHLPRKDQRASFATYAFGLVGEGARKSVEPIAARATGEPLETCRLHDRLLHFVRESPWDDRAVRREASAYVVDVLQEREPITTWIVDDTGFLKQGSHSPGVQRQYTGSAGKIANCQLGVSLVIATGTEQVPIDFELYLPKSWTEDAERREKAHIPDDVEFKTKTRLALDMIERAVAEGVPGEVVLADSFYGRWHGFRETVRELGLDYAVAVDSDTLVWPLDKLGRRRGDAVLVRDLASKLGRRTFRRTTWREGSKSKLSSHFCFQRVKVAHDDGTEPADREPVWLVIEWPKGESKPTQFVLTTLPRRMSKKQIVRTIKERWKIERTYQELKGQLGLDHFEGRSFTGWHHHVSVVLCCYAFVVAERVRSFSPSATGTSRARPDNIAA